MEIISIETLGEFAGAVIFFYLAYRVIVYFKNRRKKQRGVSEPTKESA